MIYSPSYKRAKKVLSHRLFPDVTYCVHEFEADDYRAEGHKVLVIPDNVRGNIARVRNWILDNTPEQMIVMIDDDIIEFRYIEDSSNERLRKKLSQDELKNLILQGMLFLQDSKFHLFGVNVQNDPRFYRQNMPFSFRLPILGPFCLISKAGGLRYDESLPLKEDYDFFIQNVQKFGGSVRLNAINYLCDHQKMEGGCQVYRTKEVERQNMESLIQKWGSEVIRSTEDDINPVVKV